RHVDGVHLWADVAKGRSYFWIAAFSEWSDAATGDHRGMFQREPDGVLALSYHENGDYVLLLDSHASEYRWHDVEGFDRPVVIGRDVQSLLGWLWGKRDELDPRRAGSYKQLQRTVIRRRWTARHAAAELRCKAPHRHAVPASGNRARWLRADDRFQRLLETFAMGLYQSLQGPPERLEVLRQRREQVATE